MQRLCKPNCPDCLALAMIPDPPQEVLDQIIIDPMKWLRSQKLTKYKDTTYLLTFTRNPNSRYDPTQWLRRIDKELGKSFITESLSTLEHIDTNIHCHTVIQTTHPITKTRFAVFNRDYGYVDLKRINTDNGVQAYIEKELPNADKALPKKEFLNKYLAII